MKLKFYSLTFGALMLGMMASCSNDIKDFGKENEVKDPTLKLVKSPDVITWSGSTEYGNTFGDKTRAGEETTTETSYLHNDEVEINLSLLDSHERYEIADLVSKLSIHVRKATDVKVVLPVPTSYIIESDDLYIFHEHYGELADGNGENGYHGVYGGSIDEDDDTKVEMDENGNPIILGEEFTQSLSYEIGEGENKVGEVTLSVAFGQGGIVVTTSGITQAVIDYCMGHNQDGINFEVYTYYQTATVTWEEGVKDGIISATHTPEQIAAFQETYLDASTVEFTTTTADQSLPTYYINAFSCLYKEQKDAEGNPIKDASDKILFEKDENTVNPNDCEVKPVSGYNAGMENQFHLNGSKFNTIYVLNQEGVEADHAHGGPVEGTTEPEEQPEAN